MVGGNVSLYNEHGEGAIDPTPVVSMVGLIDRQEQVTRSQEKGRPELFLWGGLVSWEQAISCRPSLQKRGVVPTVDLESEKKLQEFFYFLGLRLKKLRLPTIFLRVAYWFAFQKCFLKNISVLKFPLHPKNSFWNALMLFLWRVRGVWVGSRST